MYKNFEFFNTDTVWLVEGILSSIPFGFVYYARTSSLGKFAWCQYGQISIDPSNNLDIQKNLSS